MKKKSQSDRVDDLDCNSNPSEPMSLNTGKTLYVVKGWTGKEWKYFSTLYLNPHDSQTQKESVIKSLKHLYGQKLKYKIASITDIYFDEFLNEK